jgi:hypothetical protein
MLTAIGDRLRRLRSYPCWTPFAARHPSPTDVLDPHPATVTRDTERRRVSIQPCRHRAGFLWLTPAAWRYCCDLARSCQLGGQVFGYRPDCRNHLSSLVLEIFRVHETPHGSDTSCRCRATGSRSTTAPMPGDQSPASLACRSPCATSNQRCTNGCTNVATFGQRLLPHIEQYQWLSGNEGGGRRLDIDSRKMATGTV